MGIAHDDARRRRWAASSTATCTGRTTAATATWCASTSSRTTGRGRWTTRSRRCVGLRSRGCRASRTRRTWRSTRTVASCTSPTRPTACSSSTSTRACTRARAALPDLLVAGAVVQLLAVARARWRVLGAVTRPSGLAARDGIVYVGSHTSGDVHALDVSSRRLLQIVSLVPSGGLGALTFDVAGVLWFAAGASVSHVEVSSACAVVGDAGGSCADGAEQRRDGRRLRRARSRCAVGLKCSEATDCASGVCTRRARRRRASSTRRVLGSYDGGNGNLVRFDFESDHGTAADRLRLAASARVGARAAAASTTRRRSTETARAVEDHCRRTWRSTPSVASCTSPTRAPDAACSSSTSTARRTRWWW